MNFLFLMDPLETVIMEKDTSFILMLASYRRGHNVYFLSDGGIIHRQGQTAFEVKKVVPQAVSRQPFIVSAKEILTEDKVDAIFVRSDPPFDRQYLLNTWLLDLLPERIFVMNNPNGIRTANEKLWALQFKTLIPPTLVGRNQKEIFAFLEREKESIVKPTDGYGGQGVFRIKKSDTNTNVILEMLTAKWTKDIIVQKYLPESQKGDKRILLLEGEPLGAVLRVHAKGDHRNNFFAGGKPHPTEITVRDKKIIKALKPRLKELGLSFVGIDIIGSYLMEVNVTSPTCLQEMNRLYNVHLEDKIIDFVERKTNDTRSN